MRIRGSAGLNVPQAPVDRAAPTEPGPGRVLPTARAGETVGMTGLPEPGSAQVAVPGPCWEQEPGPERTAVRRGPDVSGARWRVCSPRVQDPRPQAPAGRLPDARQVPLRGLGPRMDWPQAGRAHSHSGGRWGGKSEPPTVAVPIEPRAP